MILSKIHIKNYRSCKDLILSLANLNALVGANNAGKSSILRALDFFFNPSVKQIDNESFWNNDSTLEIRIEGIFTELSERELEILGPYLRDDQTFQMARTARLVRTGGENNTEIEDKIEISQSYCKPQPEIPWLRSSEINGAKITEWWADRTNMIVGQNSFYNFLATTSKPSVSLWKQKAIDFIDQFRGDIPFTDSWADNPQGYSGVLKGTLPLFVLIPAVRDVTDEAKVTKSNPFGKLLYAIFNTVTDEQKARIERTLDDVAKSFNRSGGDQRVPLISETETDLNSYLGEFFEGCDLEIEFQTPTLEVLFTTPKLYVNDGFRNVVENKGHGLQRAVIFTILRRYADHMTTEEGERRRGIILAIEEPELYMHPQAQRTIRSVFRNISTRGDQVLFSTHSPLLVDVSYFDEIIRVECLRERVGDENTTESKIWQLPVQLLIDDLTARHPGLVGQVTAESMRDLYSHAYNPNRNEGFFANKIILVEGLTEEYSIPIYADHIENCPLDPKGISVIGCGGKGMMDRLYRIFNELGIPCYILFDYDVGNADTDIIEKSKKLLRLVGEPEEAPTLPLIREKIACFPIKWEAQMRLEVPNLESLTTDARHELGLRRDSGKPLVARYIARKLVNTEPPTIPPTIKEMIEKSVQVEWTGSILRSAENNEENAQEEIEE